MTTKEIRDALKVKYAGEAKWAYFEELRNSTGYGKSRVGYIDAYVAGLWQENQAFIAFEIKVSRSDFMKDIEQFAIKQADALRNSTQFYYVVPRGLLDKSEVPELAGLMSVSGKTVTTLKVAPLRELKDNCLCDDFTRSLLRATSVMCHQKNRDLILENEKLKRDVEVLAKYDGKNIGAEELKEIASNYFEKITRDEVEKRAMRMSALRRIRSYTTLKRIASATSIGLGLDRDLSDIALERLIKKLIDLDVLYRNLQRVDDYLRNSYDGLKLATQVINILREDIANTKKQKKSSMSIVQKGQNVVVGFNG